ncbi:MAG: hypothetical protein K0Q87_1331 [Neobacillus sp.]|jgi:hypothetical protein|nr:hypothetical protein [Neobacillus sp.]
MEREFIREACVIIFLKNREKPLLDRIKDDLKRKAKKTGEVSETNLSEVDLKFINGVKEKTAELNQNNVTRTKAYLDFYIKHQDIHWAFLAHMVSRNAGWNMTDLKGDFLTRILSKKERVDFFRLLERGNWLIFQDAYPQLIIYEESIKRNKPLFYLLPHLNISVFMETIWDQYWKVPNTNILTIALIINEQSYLEERVIQNPVYQKEVFNTLEFKLQDLFSFNHILFPYVKNRRVKLAGQTVHQFGSLNERILLGKRLYAILFQNKEAVKLTLEWAKNQPHTGSRKNYWPQLFNNINEGIPGFSYQLRLQSCKLRRGARRVYSPDLSSAWKDVNQQDAEQGDWFKDWKIISYLTENNETIDGEIENEYCKTLERFELAALAKKVISILD